VIGLYYYGEATMKQIGAAIGVNESRVSQLHARAVQRLKKALGAETGEVLASPLLDMQKKLRQLRMAKAEMAKRAVVLQYKAPIAKPIARRRTAVAGVRVAAAR
jgi:RNA polymerase sigma factor for flagellar operon FliA